MNRQTANKFNAVGSKYNGIYFPSQLEKMVYILLHNIDSQTIVHPKLTLIPITHQSSGYIHPNGEFVPFDKWKAPTWIPDFYTPRLNLYVEAKGKITPDFRTKMRVLATVNTSVLESLVCVGYKSTTWEGLKIFDIGEFKRFLIERKNG